MKPIEKVEKFIAHQQLFGRTDKLVVGLSGGSDSVALLHVLVALGYDCLAAHCNFHLRGEESMRDEHFVRKLCENYDVPCLINDMPTTEYAKSRRISIEMAARELRYAWFEELREKQKAHRIAIAHHLDDSIETVLLNLIRGTGIKGLTGISPLNGHVVRPLLCLSKEEVMAYINDHQLPYVDDSTNQETVYQRNKIRHELLPLLTKINPAAKEALARMISHLSQVEHIYAECIQKEQENILRDNKICIEALEASIEPEAFLFEILAPYGFNSKQLSLIYESRRGIAGKTFFSPTHRVTKDRHSFIIDKIAPKESHIAEFTIFEKDASISTPIDLCIETVDYTHAFDIPRNPQVLCVDRDKIKFPLTLRKWQQGDWFVPFGMKGKKKISDYFSDQKFSLQDKESTWILAMGDEIIWLVGHRPDNRYRVEKDTKRILIVSSN